METGDGNGDVRPVLELKGVEGEEKLVVGLHRSRESEDEVFEEAMGTVVPVLNSEDRVVSDDKNSRKVEDLSGPVEVNHTSENGDDEVERFEEAIGVELKDGDLVIEVPSTAEGSQVPIEIPNRQRESGEKAEVLVSEVPPVEVANEGPSEIPNGVREPGEKAEVLMTEVPTIEEANKAPSEVSNGASVPGEKAGLSVTGKSPIVEQDAPEEVLVNGGEEIKIDGIKEDGEHDSGQAADLDAAVETYNNKDEVGEITSEGPKKPSNGDVHHLNMDLIQDGIVTDKQEKHHHEQPETQDANEVKGGYTDSGQEVKSNGDIVHQNMTSVEVNEPSGIPDTDNHENRCIEEYSPASLYSKHPGVKNNEEIGDASNSASEKTHEPQSQQMEQQGNLEEEEEKDIPSISAAIDSQHESDTLKGNILSSVEDKSQSLEGERSSIALDDFSLGEGVNVKYGSLEEERASITLDDSSLEEGGKVPAVEKSPPLNDNLFKDVSSSGSVVESSGLSQPKLASANGGTSKILVDQPERKAEKDEEAKKSIASSGGEEVKPAVASSTTVRSAPTPAARPAGLGRAAPLLEPAHRVVQQPRANGSVTATQNQLVEEPINGEAEEYDETREKLQMIRVKFLRLAHRLGQTPHNVVVAQVLYRLGLAEQLRGRSGGRVAAFSFDRASAMAEQLEAAGQEPLDFSCTIMVLGKSGVGKSATINSIFDEVKFGTDAFQLGTKKVQDVIGTVQGIKVRVIDTPGLLPSWSDQRQNERILHSVKRFIKKTPPDIVLYLDRLDMQSRDFGDMPLLRTITDIFGPSIWFNAIVVLTHAASAPPEGPNGTATSYDMFVTQRSHAVQNAIRQAAGDMRLMNPVSLVENHSACRTNPAGQRVLPNGQVWKPHLLLLSFASKILAEANTLLKLQDSPPGRPFATRTRAPPLPFLLSSLLQSRPQVKLPTDQDDDDSLDDDLDESSDSEDESEYDQLPPFRSLTKAQLAKLPKDQRKAYHAELEYREKLFMKKQLKEERKRRKMMKKMQAMAKDLPTDYNESAEEESVGAASVPVPMPDLALPASFDSDNPTHRYRSLDSSNQWLVRPVLEPNGWDHDVGYEGINVERLFVVKDKVPFSFSGQVSKDKKDTNLQMEVATSVKHGEGKTSSLGFDMQSVGKDIAYTLRGESRLINYRRNKATTGLSVTVLGDSITGGVKVEDRLIVNKRGQVVVSGGAMFGRGDVAYGGSLEATLRDKDHPLGRFLSTLGLSIMDWHGDLAIGCNSQTQIPIGRYTNLIGRININNKGSGQVSVRLNSSEQLQIALVALIPFARKLLGYSQSAQFG